MRSASAVTPLSTFHDFSKTTKANNNNPITAISRTRKKNLFSKYFKNSNPNG